MRGSGAAVSTDKSPQPLYMDPGEYMKHGQYKDSVKYMDPGEYIQPGQYKESSHGKDKDKDNTSNNCFAFKQKIIALAVLAVLVLVVGIIVFKKYAATTTTDQGINVFHHEDIFHH